MPYLTEKQTVDFIIALMNDRGSPLDLAVKRALVAVDDTLLLSLADDYTSMLDATIDPIRRNLVNDVIDSLNQNG